MNILLSVHHYMDRNAGAPGVTYQLCEEYRKLGHRVDIFSYDQLPRGLPDSLINLLFPQYLHAYCRRLERSAKPDVIDGSSGDLWFHGMMHGKGEKTVLVTRSHGLEHMAHDMTIQRVRKGEVKLSWKYPLYHGGLRLWEVARSFLTADGSIFLNRHEHEYAVKKFGLDSSEVIGNGIPDYLLNLPLQDTPVHGDTIRIAFIGTYIPRKGIQFAAESLSSVLSRYENVEITFLGTICPRETVLQDYDAGLHSRIRVVPRFDHPDLPILLQDHQILLFPSLSEGFGLALVEAMACGLVPIATSIPGPSDIVTGGHDAVVIPPGDAAAITMGLELLLDNPDRMHHLRVNAHETAQRYSWRLVAEKTIAFYERCAERKAEETKHKLESIG